MEPEPSKMSREQIRQELASIVIGLTELPEDDFSTRADLQDRRRSLQAEIAARPLANNDIVSIQRELVGLKRRLAEIRGERPNIAAMNDGGPSHGGMPEIQRWVWDYDDATGLTEIEQLIKSLERRIAGADDVSG